MALIQEFEESGNFLFKYRGQIPVVIFLMALPMLFFSNSNVYFSWAVGELQLVRLLSVIIGIVLSSLGFAVRCYTIGTTPRGTSGRNTQNQVAEQLNTTGIYSIVRHPLYLGNYFMWAGLLTFTMNIWCFIIVSLMYWLYYERIMLAEEQFLTKKFGKMYTDWSMTVPSFLPAFSQFKKSDIPFSFKAVLRREYSSFLSMVVAYTLVDYLLAIILKLYNSPVLSLVDYFHRPSMYVLLVTVIVVLVLRTLKHHTKFLDPEKNRD